MAEKIITYEVKLVVNHYNTQHIKQFTNALQKMINVSGVRHTQLAGVNLKK